MNQDEEICKEICQGEGILTDRGSLSVGAARYAMIFAMRKEKAARKKAEFELGHSVAVSPL